MTSELQSYQKLHRELEAIFESSYDGFYIADGKADTIRVNKAYERITGLSREKLIGRNLNDLVAEKVFDSSVFLAYFRLSCYSISAIYRYAPVIDIFYDI